MEQREVKFKLMEVDGNKVKKAKAKKSTQKQMIEFSKKMVIGMGIMIFIVIIFAMVMIWRTGSGIDCLLNFMAVVGGATILGYCSKFVFENPAKIKNKSEQDIISTVQNYIPTLVSPSTITPTNTNVEMESEV